MTLRTPRLLVLATALALTGCPKKAPKSKIVDTESEDPKVVFQSALDALVTDKTGAANYQGAYDAFVKSAGLTGSPKAYFNAGWAAEKMGDLDKAAQQYRAAFDKDVNYQPAMFSLARVLIDQKKFDDAAAVYARYLDGKPDDLDVRAEYMDALVQAGKDAEAIAEGQAILRKNPNSDAVYRALSGLYLREGNLQMARLMGDKALALDDKDPNIYNNLGVVLLRNGDEPGAIEKFQLARKLDSTHFEANLNLGLIGLNAGDYALANECFDAALQRDPSSFEARVGKAVALRGAGDTAGATKIYDELISEEPSNRIAYFNAATLHEKYTKDFNKALKYLTAYKDAHVGEVGPDDEVFTRMKRVEDAKAAEEERKRIEAEKKKAEEERQKRAMELLAAMEKQVTDMKATLEKNAACLPEEVKMEVEMGVEQAGEAIASKDTQMAADIQSLLDDYFTPMLAQALADNCAATAPAPSPEGGSPEGADAAPGEGAPADAAPADAAPADAAPTEAAPTESTPPGE